MSIQCFQLKQLHTLETAAANVESVEVVEGQPHPLHPRHDQPAAVGAQDVRQLLGVKLLGDGPDHVQDRGVLHVVLTQRNLARQSTSRCWAQSSPSEKLILHE